MPSKNIISTTCRLTALLPTLVLSTACSETFNPDCITQATAGHHLYEKCGRMSFAVEVPDQCATEQCGLIVDVHGGTMTAEQQDANTNMRELGRQHGYVILQPSAPLGNVSAEHDAQVRTVIQRLVEVYNLDPKRVHMTGFSQGGYMTWRFICHSSDIIASAAPMAAATGGNNAEPPGCSFTGDELPKEEIPLLFLHGSNDEWVSYEAGLAQRDAIVAAWQMGSGEVISGDDSHRRIRYTNEQGTVLEFLSHDYSSELNFIYKPVGGHCFPGSTAYEREGVLQLGAFGCEQPNSFHWGEEAVKFFMQHPKP